MPHNHQPAYCIRSFLDHFVQLLFVLASSLSHGNYVVIKMPVGRYIYPSCSLFALTRSLKLGECSGTCGRLSLYLWKGVYTNNESMPVLIRK